MVLFGLVRGSPADERLHFLALVRHRWPELACVCKIFLPSVSHGNGKGPLRRRSQGAVLVGDQGEAATRGGGQNPTLATQHNAHAPVWAYASPDQANWNVTRSEAVGPR